MLLALCLVSVCFWPGHMNADTLYDLQQVRSGQFTNQHAPLLLALWHPLWNLGLGTGFVLAAQTAAVLVGGYLILRTVLSPVAAAVAIAVIALLPQVFGDLGLIGRDIWFAAALLVAFGAAIRASAAAGMRRVGWLVCGLAAAWVALAARQNAAFAVFLATTALIAVPLARAPFVARARPILRRAYYVIAGVAMTALLIGTQLIASSTIHVRNVHPTQYTELYDLGALSLLEHRNLFPADVLADRSLTPVQRYWNVNTVTTLLYLPTSPIRTPLPQAAVQDLSHAWRSQLEHHPFDYLDVRGRLWLRQASITRRAVWIYHPGIDPNPWGLRIRFPGPNAAARSYVQAFASDDQLDGSIIHAVVIYLVLALAGTIAFLRRRSPPALAILGALFLSAITYQVGLFFGATGDQYRFEFPVVVVGLIAACAIVAHLWRRRRPSGSGAPIGRC